MKKRIQIVMHVPFEGAGNIKEWADKNDFDIVYTKLYAGEILPDINTFCMAAVMGGPMNIYESELYPWLEDEKKWLAEIIAAEIPVVGICLGAQLLADAIGGRVVQNDQKEIGYFNVTNLAADKPDLILSVLPHNFNAIHWHGDKFVLPETATLLAESQACESQAFQYKNHVLGLQFHLDYNQQSFCKMIEFCSDDLKGGDDFVQDSDEILAAGKYTEDSIYYLDLLLDKLYHGNE